jgi:non-specific serine/threonine protein kinase
LLDDCERVLFRRLAIFANGWTLEAAERVCTGEVLERAAVLDALLSLVTKSLVLVDLDAPLPRYYFFESTRAFALEQLGASGEYDSVARAHAQWMATFAEHCLSRAHETGGKWHTEAAPEIENVLAALAWAFSSGGDAVLGARVAANLEWGWMRAAFAEQGIRYMNAALARLDAQEHPALVGRLMLAQCGAAANHFDVDRLRQTVALLASDANVCLVAKAHGMLAQALSVSGASDEAVAVSDKAFELLREAKLESSAAYARHLELRGLILCFRPGRLEEARTCVAEAVELAHALGSNSLVMILQHTFAQFEFLTGDAASAAALVASSLNAARAERGWLSGSEIGALSNLASYQLALGEIDAAQASAREALTLAHPARDVAAHMAIQHLAAVAALRSELRTAARLLGYVNNWLARMPESRTRDPIDQSSYDILTASLRRQLTDEEATALMAKGALLSQDAAVAEALALTSEPLATG